MFRIKIIISLALFFILMACAPQKKIFFFDKPIPPQVYTPAAAQEFFDHPPLYIPKGNRKTIDDEIFSPNFTIAIPNAMDMTGRSSDLQKSLADILCTELANYPGKRRIKLLDRGALVNLDKKIIIDSLNNQKSVSSDQKENKEIDRSKKLGNIQNIFPFLPFPTLEKKEGDSGNDTENLKEETVQLRNYLEKADGILLLYITSRVGTESGHFEVDYRIVISRGSQKNIVLLAGSEKVQFSSNTEKQIEYKRDGVVNIAKKIYEDMTIRYDNSKDKTKLDIQIIKCDPPFIVINIGKENNLIPGMIGYVVEVDRSINAESRESYTHYSYIAEFIVTDVFSKTSNALLIRPESDWGVRVDDLIVIK